MSNVCYFASNAKLGGKENPYMKYFSINEALAVGINLDLGFLEGIDRDEPGVIAWCENEDYFEFPTIWITEPYEAAPKSDKKYYAEMGGNPLMDIPGILQYIQNHMAENPEVEELELWDVWIGQGKFEFVEKTCKLDELTVESLTEIFYEERPVDWKLTIVR